MSLNRYMVYQIENKRRIKDLKVVEAKVRDVLRQREMGDPGAQSKALSVISDLLEDVNLNAGALADLILSVFEVGKKTGKDNFKKHIANL